MTHPPPAPAATRISLEQGKRWVFAAALDWPGWCRRGRGNEAAIDVLLDYRGRYARVAGPGFAPGQATVVVQMREQAVRVGVHIDLAAVMTWVAVTGHARSCVDDHARALSGCATAAMVRVSPGLGAASGVPGTAVLPG